MKVTKILMTAAAAVVIAAPAMANDTPVAPPAAQTTTIHHVHHYHHHHHHMMAGSFFDRLDTNHDGVISKNEWMADASKKFSDVDVNHDGKVTRAELAQFHENMMKEHPEWAHHEMAPPPADQSWDHHTTWTHHVEYYNDNRPNLAAPGVSTSAPPAYNETDPNDRRPAGADGAGGWTRSVITDFEAARRRAASFCAA